MPSKEEEYVIDNSGKRSGILLRIALLAGEEVLACVRAYNEAKGAQDESIHFGEAMKEIDKRRE